MTKENTEIVITKQEIDLGIEAKRQLHNIATSSLDCAREPVRVFLYSVVDYCWNRFECWLDDKFSA